MNLQTSGRSRGCAFLFALVVSFDAPALKKAAPNTSVGRQQDSSRFQEAYALIQNGHFRTALTLLQRNIAETPDAGDIDYAYGWAVVCAAHLGDLDLTLKYYEVMRTRF